MTEFCDLCGKNLALVGRRHHCVPLRGARGTVGGVTFTDRHPVNVNSGLGVVVSPLQSADPEFTAMVDKIVKPNRRAYMRDYMRRKRAK